MNNKEYIFNAIGKRKTAIAKVILKPGVGNILVNNKTYNIFFKNLGHDSEIIKLPLILTNFTQNYDIITSVLGGGLRAQLNAILLGISRVLLQVNPEFRTILNQENLLHRDSRIKERRKYGLKKARKASQFSKR